ncbi:hypothetical protein HMPREF0518_0540 [Lactobacillus helveticus DSM 20075 = CGMCC 1.1877]|nr:hypothetical protein HMPREF0518_0540 [Lactobacillus helveticus DSM 20075 = CGMCC 1.1877]
MQAKIDYNPEIKLLQLFLNQKDLNTDLLTYLLYLNMLNVERKY